MHACARAGAEDAMVAWNPFKRGDQHQRGPFQQRAKISTYSSGLLSLACPQAVMGWAL